jgi:hypothetical protein
MPTPATTPETPRTLHGDAVCVGAYIGFTHAEHGLCIGRVTNISHNPAEEPLCWRISARYIVFLQDRRTLVVRRCVLRNPSRLEVHGCIYHIPADVRAVLESPRSKSIKMKSRKPMLEQKESMQLSAAASLLNIPIPPFDLRGAEYGRWSFVAYGHAGVLRIGRVEAIKHSNNGKTAGPRVLVRGVDATNPEEPKLCGLRYLKHPERALILLHHMVPARIRQAFKVA